MHYKSIFNALIMHCNAYIISWIWSHITPS